jgi:hypothetical protein
VSKLAPISKTSVMDEEVLHGGVANAGTVTRLGNQVFRPSNPHTPTIHRFLAHIRAAGFGGASEPIGVDADGRERLHFISGDVPTPPFPDWAQHDNAISSTAQLLRGLHDASVGFDWSHGTWSSELADLTSIDDPTNAARLGWGDIDRVRRLRLVADAYGLDAAQRAEVIECLDTTINSGGEFVRRRVEAGDANFIAMWGAMGGAERFDRRRAWWAEQRDAFAAALADSEPV